MKSIIAFTVVVSCALKMPVLCQAASYAYTITGLGTAGGTSSAAYAISDNGLVTGTIGFDPFFGADAFLYDGTMHDLGLKQANAEGFLACVAASGAGARSNLAAFATGLCSFGLLV